jgi:hypothetical protein
MKMVLYMKLQQECCYLKVINYLKLAIIAPSIQGCKIHLFHIFHENHL